MTSIEQPAQEHDHSIPEWILNTKIPDGSITKDNEGEDGEYAAFRSHLQVFLAIKSAGSSNEDLDMWITKYSEPFQKAYDAIIEESPLAFHDYPTIGELIGSKVLEDLESRLYN